MNPLVLTPLEPSSAPLSATRRQAQEGDTPSWLCIHLPRLPLEVLTTAPATHPRVVVEAPPPHPLVHTASRAATRRGIRAGYTVEAARALCPDLQVHPRDPAAEQRHLQRLATWAGEFTPTLSLAPPQALLLEIRGSLRLFGGLARLQTQVMTGLKARGHDFSMSITPTPRASLWLARAGVARVIEGHDALRSTLGRLPLSALPLDPALDRRLARAGLCTLSDLWRLPRDGLARRFGPGLLLLLDQALGNEPDPQPLWDAPRSFRETLELEEPLDSHARLLEYLALPLGRLCSALRSADAAITRLHIHLLHGPYPSTRITVGTRRSTRDPGHLLDLTREHLQRIHLTMAVRGIQLETDPAQAYEPEEGTLLPPGEGSGTDSETWEQLIEQLQARLGRGRVTGLSIDDELRPERAWRGTPPQGPDRPPPASHRRPLWLLATPEPLPLRQGHPWRQGRLSLQTGPERIETGWWEGREIRRDYFLVTDPDHNRLWIYRDLRSPGGWYLHGYFG